MNKKEKAERFQPGEKRSRKTPRRLPQKARESKEREAVILRADIQCDSIHFMLADVKIIPWAKLYKELARARKVIDKPLEGMWAYTSNAVLYMFKGTISTEEVDKLVANGFG